MVYHVIAGLIRNSMPPLEIAGQACNDSVGKQPTFHR
jgi:hypothetical protein